MELVISQESDYILVRTRGPIDESASELFREQLHPLVGQSGMNFIVDLSGSPRINSRGISALVLLVTDSNTHEHRIIFAAPSPFVSGVFNTTRLNKFFDVATSLNEAIGRLERPTAT